MVSMNKMKTFFRRLKYKMRHDYFTVENMVLLFAIILCLVWTYQSVAAMSRNWELSERLTKEKKELELARIEVETAELENEYYKTDEYRELLARKYLDKEMSGEHMVILPENSEEAKNKYEFTEVETKEVEYSNTEKWVNFLFPNF